LCGGWQFHSDMIQCLDFLQTLPTFLFSPSHHWRPKRLIAPPWFLIHSRVYLSTTRARTQAIDSPTTSLSRSLPPSPTTSNPFTHHACGKGVVFQPQFLFAARDDVCLRTTLELQ
jgi:hypothetical protein